jgi:hypothetical protein
MTSPILPEFILKLFQNEINNIVQGEIKKVCDLYDLDIDEVTKKLGHVKLDMTKTPGFRLIKKQEKFAETEIRCCARMLHDLEVKQCSRPNLGGQNLCKIHYKMKLKGNLKYGLFTDPIPDELRPEILAEKNKTKIY